MQPPPSQLPLAEPQRFDWTNLPADVKQLILDAVSLPSLLHKLQQVFPRDAPLCVHTRIAALSELWRAWVVSPIDVRNVPSFRTQHARRACLPTQFCFLRRLVLGSSSFRRLPVAITEFVELRVLHLDHNHLQQLPDCISACSSLVLLDLSHNHFRAIPPVVLRLPSLKNLNLEHNPLETLPVQITTIPRLNTLVLNSCRLTFLPSELLQLVQRADDFTLQVSNNRFPRHYILELTRSFPGLRYKLVHVIAPKPHTRPSASVHSAYMPRFGLRAIDMAAPAVLPANSFPHAEPAVSAQTAKTSTCCASIRGAPGRRFSSAPNTVAQGEPIVNHLRSFLEAAAVKPPPENELPQFTLGMHLKDGVARRLEWKALKAEISRAEAVTAKTKSSLSARARQRYLLDLRRSVSNAIYGLLRDERCEDRDMRSYVTNILVWADPQNARKAIVKEAVADYVREVRSKPEDGYRYPVIVLATEKAGFQVDQEPCETATTRSTGDVNRDHIQFLEAWREAVTGEAEVLTVVGDTAGSMRGSLEAVLEGSDHHWASTPIIIVMYASYDSAITANMSSIRRLCDANNIKLCVEGPGLAFIAQAARPSDPNECLQHADVLLTNPGSWFGFEECAFTSIHCTHSSSSCSTQSYGHDSKIASITSDIQREDQRQGKAVAYVTKLWTVISQIGVPRIREKVDAVTHTAEALIYHLRDCQSLTTSYEGVGCIVRLSYELSTGERGFSKIEEAEILSAINRSLYRYVSTEAKELQVFLVMVDNISVLQFSPLRMLTARTFWVPEGDQVRKFTNALRQRAEFYRLCRTGALVFMERMALCSDIELLEDDEVKDDVLHWYGAFRVVPDEWQGTWEDSSSGRHVTTTLTKMFVSELSDSFAGLVMRSPSLKQLLESCSFQGSTKSTRITGNSLRKKAANPLEYIFRRGSCANHMSLEQSVTDLPFSFYIHYDDATFNAPFVSVEPKRAHPVNRAYRHACTAAEIVVTVLQVVLRKYRSKDVVASPSHGSVYNPVESERTPVESFPVSKPETSQEEQTQVCTVDGSSLEEPEISSTDVNRSDDDGFVSASNTLCTESPVTREANPSLYQRDTNSYRNRDKYVNAKPHNTEQGHLRDCSKIPGEGASNDGVSIIETPPTSSSATHTQFGQGVQSRIPWMDLVTTEHLSSDADSEGSDGEYTDEEDDSLTEEDGSLTEDGSDYQDTDSSDQESDEGSSEDDSSENESSESSADEGYSGNEESDGESETSSSSSSSSDIESDHENSTLEAMGESKTEMRPASELVKGNIKRSAWLSSWFGAKNVQGPSPIIAANVHDVSQHVARSDAEMNSSRRNTSHRRVSPNSKSPPTSCSSRETSESESVVSSETIQSSSTEDSNLSSSNISEQHQNPPGKETNKSSKTSKSYRQWGWWKQKTRTNSESDEASNSSEDQRPRRPDDDEDTSSSYDDDESAFPGAFSIASSEVSSTASQESVSESNSETNEGSSHSSSTSSNSSIESETQRSRTRGLSDNKPRRPWFPYFGYYGFSSVGGSGRKEKKSSSSNRRRRY